MGKSPKRPQRGETVTQHVGAYDRERPYVEVTFTCAVCGKTQTILKLPGPAPKFCPPVDGKRSACQKKNDYQRLKDWRKSHRPKPSADKQPE